MRLQQLLNDYYRCGDTIGSLITAMEVEGDAGYFRLSPNIICYGRLTEGRASATARGDLYDASENIKLEDGRYGLPFDAAEVIDNFRREVYAREAADQVNDYPAFVRELYYFVRPLLGVAFRKHLQRRMLLRRQGSQFPSWPLDCTVDYIFQQLLGLCLRAGSSKEVPFIWFWPEGISACVTLTHDVETTAGLQSCPTLMDIDDSYQFKASFQLVPEGRYKVTAATFDEMRSRGFEINVHDWNHDGQLFSNKQIFLQRVSKINAVGKEWDANGFRAGALYRNIDWLQQLEMSYDMSVPNVGRMDPQRGGCCTIMPYFIGSLLEIPVTCIQDYSLFHILGDYSINIWQRQLASIIAMNGLASFIVHPDYVIDGKAQAVYKELLQYLAELRQDKTVWVAKPGDINEWWRQRSEMGLVREGGRWRIQGAGRERAVIAYARWDGTCVRYRLGEGSDDAAEARTIAAVGA